MRAVYLLIVACQQLEDQCLWLADRLVDNGLLSVIFQPLSRCNTTHCALAGRYGRFFTKLLIYVLFAQFSQYSIYQNTISVFQLLNLKSHLSYQEPLVLIF